MKRNNIRQNYYEVFYKNKDIPLIDLLINSAADEFIDIDVNKNSFEEFYHVEGKYFSPTAIHSFSELCNFCFEHTVHPDDRQTYWDLMNPDGILDRLSKSKIPNFDFAHFRYRLQDGEYRYVEQCLICGEENNVAPGHIKLFVFDIHNLKTRELGQISDEKGVIAKDRDPKTGLLTAQAFLTKAQEIIDAKKKEKWCLISMDIEHFKFFDEWYGRETGDYLLAKIGAIIVDNHSLFKGIAGYFGQDDFVILSIFDFEIIEKLYEKIREVIISFGMSFGFIPAFGVSQIEKGVPLADIIDRCSIAAAKAKSDVKNHICVYDSNMRLSVEKEYRVLTEYMSAFKNDEITFYLQPQCRISTGKVVGAESLARWIKPSGEIIPPDYYIPILEKYGFITDLDQRLWDKVCSWLKSWIEKGYKAVPISLNVSRADIYAIDIYKHFIDLTEKYNIPHNLLKLEITESAYTETTTLIDELVNKLRKADFQVLMDDFGSGYSSLNMLSNLEVDAIKLDANFLHIRDEGYEKGIHILESVVNMAKTIALPIIVEGVENQEQSDFLEEMGCRYVQGFHFYRPMPLEKFEKLIGFEKNIDERGFVAKHNDQFRIREFLDKNIYSDSMLNNILGPVAIYSWREKTHVDIVRFNQQFYEAVNVPDFHDKLENIEELVPPEDKVKIYAALENSIKNHLGGSSATLRFYRIDGTMSFFSIRFYYLGRKEGEERFYGSATNVTELVDLRREMQLIAENSSDNIIFIKRIYGKWVYSVASHGLADLFGLTPAQLEAEMNNGKFAKRVVSQRELADFMRASVTKADNRENFEKEFTVRNDQGKEIKIKLEFKCVNDLTSNVEYILKTTEVK